jgi:peptidoglycan/LPS O-acetylase OafA/YrhL
MALESSLMNRNFNSINLLRSIAIFSVLAFHFFPGFFPFGYLGVDVFFIVSGFLVSQQISRQFHSGVVGFNAIVLFWKKRIVRIYPSLVLTVFVTLLLTYLYGNFKLLREVSFEAVASLLGVLNFQLYESGGYFDIPAQTKPLLHLWSLSIEIQFYFLAPFFFYLFRKNKKLLLSVLGLLLIMVSYLSITTSFIFSYYSSALRFSQFFMGAAVYFICTKLRVSSKFSNKVFFSGFLLLILTFAFSPFYLDWSPSLLVIFSLAVSVLLFYGISSEFVLCPKIDLVFRLIGQSTLSIYLIHWILIVFYKLYSGQNLTVLSSGVLFLLALGLGLSGRNLVEKRFTLDTRIIYLKISFILFLILFLAANMINGNFLSNNLKTSRNFEVSTSFDSSPYSSRSCTFLTNEVLLKNFCTEWNFEAYDKTILVWGDSFSNSWIPTFLKQTSGQNTRVIQISHAACPPIFGVVRIDESFASEWCNTGQLQKEVVINLDKMELSKVFLIARWSLYTERFFRNGVLVEKPFIFDPSERSSIRESSQKVFAQKLPLTIAKLNAYAPVVIFLETPTMPIDLSLAKFGEYPFISRTQYLDFTKFSRSIIQSLENPSVRILDPLSKVCDNVRCSSYVDSFPLYSDDAHPSLILIDLFKPELEYMVNDL